MENYRMDEVDSLKLLEHLISRISGEKKDLTPCVLDEAASEEEKSEICIQLGTSASEEF
jgi:hypothetical protein